MNPNQVRPERARPEAGLMCARCPAQTGWSARTLHGFSMEGKRKVSVRVLVVEDDDDLARLLTIRLRNANFIVERAADGEAGVRLTREFDPEFVLMDWMMPVKSGIEAVEEIRADPTIRQPYIAILSARTTADDIERAERAGVDEYIVKPASAHTVIDRVSSVIDKRRELTTLLFAEPELLRA
jgi:DNA-binding response OmpR family regulator